MANETGQPTGQVDILINPMTNCQFAYTINNMQPVRCSWISDQPLFFSDADIAEEEEILDDPIFKALEKDIEILRHKTDAYEKISAEFVLPPESKTSMFRDNADFISTPYKETIEAPIADMLRNSRFASVLLSFAEVHGIDVKQSRQVTGVTYDRETSSILVHADLDEGTKILLTARELRRAWQHRNGAGLHPLMLHPDHAVLVNRAQLADMTIAMVRVAWELQLAGEKAAWIVVENSTLSDLGRSFAREACSDFRSLNSGKAAIACFEAWFLSERCRKADRSLIQQMLADYQGYVFADNADASRSITSDLLNALGKMPFGDNYLSKTVSQIMGDAVFTDVRDRSNANFLWFIKFERSFRDAEDEVSRTDEKNSGDSAVKTTKINKVKETRPSAQIISFPAHVETAPMRRQASGSGKSGGDIVLFIPSTH